MVVDMNERVSVVGVDKRIRLAQHLLAGKNIFRAAVCVSHAGTTPHFSFQM